MDFSTDRPIFRQIADLCHQHILAGSWQPGGRIPSVRELAVQLGVNTHTVLKALELLQADGIIVPRRGMGYYLAPGALLSVQQARRREFFSATVPRLRAEMDALGITPRQLLEALDRADGAPGAAAQ